jgi:predicted dehydrogenase
LADGQIRVGVIGLGAFGGHHARHYAGHPGAALAVVADIDAGRADAVAELYGAAACSDWRDLIGRVDAVSVAVPATLHASVARDFLDAGVHVLIEKPIAVASADARDLVARAERAGVVLQVGHIERFSPVFGALQRRVANPRRISCMRRAKWNGRAADVDVVLDLMIHDIDLILALAGSPVASVAASGTVVRSGATDEAEAWLTFAGGLVATLSASRVAGENERRVVITEPGTIYTADLAASGLEVASRSKWGAAAEAVALSPRDNLAAEIDAFLDSVTTGTPPLVDGRAGLAALEVAERIQAAIADSDASVARSVAQ